jgi:hypothetical protein
MFDINSIKTLDVFSFEAKDGKEGIGLVINGVPYLSWTRVYQNLELTPGHADKVLRMLDPETDYISIRNHELKEIQARFDITSNLGYSSSVYHFVSRKGYNRAIMEVDDSRMKDRKIAAAIRKRKDDMARIFAEFETGTLALPKPRKRQGQIVTPVMRDAMSSCKVIGIPHHQAVFVAIDIAEKKTGYDLTGIRVWDIETPVQCVSQG